MTAGLDQKVSQVACGPQAVVCLDGVLAYDERGAQIKRTKKLPKPLLHQPPSHPPSTSA